MAKTNKILWLLTNYHLTGTKYYNKVSAGINCDNTITFFGSFSYFLTTEKYTGMLLYG